MVDYAKVAQVGPLVHGLEEEKQAQADSGGKMHLEDSAPGFAFLRQPHRALCLLPCFINGAVLP